MSQMQINDEKNIIGQESLPTTSLWVDIRRRFLKNRLATLGLIILTTIIVMVIAAPLLTKYDPVLYMNLKERLLPVGSADHILGTDDYGRDVFSRLLYGGRISILTGLIVASIAAVVGVIVGCISGYYGGWIDTILMRLVDIVLAFPFLVLAITIMAVLGPSQRNTVIALAFVSWPGFARLTRGQVLMVKGQEYVESARAVGFSNARILLNHVLPNCLGPIIVLTTLSIGSAILSAASLNFLGLSVDAAQPEWGSMLNQGRDFIQTNSNLTMIPGIAISLTVLSMNWMGDGLRDALDPRLRK